jgi:dTMP kinase
MQDDSAPKREKPNEKGLFIVLEGIDGSGKTTIMKNLERYLCDRGYTVYSTKEPSSGDAGLFIRSVLRKEKVVSQRALQLLFWADRADHIDREVEPHLANNEIVISDRYMFSTIAYGTSSGVKKEMLYDILKYFRIPDLTLYIDIPAEVALHRINHNRKEAELFERESVLKAVRDKYLELSKAFNFRVINGDKPEEEVSKSVQRTVQGFLEEMSFGAGQEIV